MLVMFLMVRMLVVVRLLVLPSMIDDSEDCNF
jgi:hypothetical protein